MKSQKKQHQKTLIIGATGKIGSLVLKNLMNLGEIVRVSSRHPASANFPSGIETVTLDPARPETIAGALDGITKIFLYAHTEGIQELMNKARAAGVAHIVLLSSSSVFSNNTGNFLVQRHLTVEQAISASRIPYTFLRPVAFSSNTLLWRHQIKNENKARFAYPLAQTAAIHEFDIAAVASRVLTTPGYEGQSPLLTGPESITQLRQLELIAGATGKKISFEELEPDEAFSLMRKNMPPEYANVLLNTMKDRVGIPAKISNAVEAITGRPPKTFEAWALENSPLFK